MNVATSQELDRNSRLMRIVLGTALLMPLAVAWFLQPDPAGMGTHQQLGWDACVFPTRWGIRCPACGMTTAWANCVRGQWSAALAANVGGTLTCLTVASIALLSFAAAVVGRRVVRVSVVKLTWIVLMAVFAVTLVDWIARVVR